jgi:hypothetical protein
MERSQLTLALLPSSFVIQDRALTSNKCSKQLMEHSQINLALLPSFFVIQDRALLAGSRYTSHKCSK